MAGVVKRWLPSATTIGERERRSSGEGVALCGVRGVGGQGKSNDLPSDSTDMVLRADPVSVVRVVFVSIESKCPAFLRSCKCLDRGTSAAKLVEDTVEEDDTASAVNVDAVEAEVDAIEFAGLRL